MDKLKYVHCKCVLSNMPLSFMFKNAYLPLIHHTCSHSLSPQKFQLKTVLLGLAEKILDLGTLPPQISISELFLNLYISPVVKPLYTISLSSIIEIKVFFFIQLVEARIIIKKNCESTVYTVCVHV